MVKIKDLPRVDRPREKLLKYGPIKLTTTELLAIVLRTGSAQMNVLELSSHVLKKLRNSTIANITSHDLMKIKGLGPTKATEVIAAMELGKRLLREKEHLKAISPQAVYESLREISQNKKEHFIALYLDTRQQEIAREVISIGILNASLVHPREVFEPAVKYLANSVIVVHNHPSGDPTPSHEDVLVTKQLKDAGKLLDIALTDHLIITKNGYLSFREHGLV